MDTIPPASDSVACLYPTAIPIAYFLRDSDAPSDAIQVGISAH